MIKKSFKDMHLSYLGMGNMRLPITDDGKGNIDYKKAEPMIDYAMKMGINYYDTAYTYHNKESETFLGDVLSKYERSSYHLATKFNIHAGTNYEEVFEEQLKKLQTDYIDFYLIHSLADSTFQKYIDIGSVDWLIEQKKKGRIKHLGFSSHASVKVLETFADYTKWDFAQIQLNYFDWLYGTAKKEYEALRKRDIPIIVMEPVRGGRLTQLTKESSVLLEKAHPDWSLAKWAFMWLKRLDGLKVILSGMSNLEQLEENIEIFSDEIALKDEDTKILLKSAKIHHSFVTVPCTGCGYCMDDCPSDINIPDFLTVYNKYKTDGLWHARREAQEIITKGLPIDCISCGNCNNVCPQNIDVVSLMELLSNLDIYQ